MKRCFWAGSDPLMLAYHDTEWGVPLHDDHALFEFIILEGAQAGLSWQTVLNKRAAYRQAMHRFDPAKVARYTAKDARRLLTNPGIIRNRLKIAATIQNAKAFLAVQKEFGRFDTYLWRFVQGQPINRRVRSRADLRARSPESDALSKDLLARGFKFVGSTICYALMQAVGMVNDHQTNCFRYRQVQRG